MVSTAGPTNLNYPLLYAPAATLKQLTVGMSALLFAGGIAGISVALFAPKPEEVGLRPWLISMGLMIVGFAIYGVRFVFRTRLTLYADRAEYRGGFRTVSVRRSDIAGRTGEQANDYATSFKIIRQAPVGLPISVAMYASPDDAFRAWFADIPIVGMWQPDDLKASALSDPAWGSSPDERRSRMARASKFARYVSVAGYALAAGGIFFPRPYGLWILALVIVPLSLFLWTLSRRGRWALRQAKEDFRPQVGDAIALPTLALAFRALSDLHIIDTAVLLGLCAVVSVGAAVASYSLARSGPGPRWTVALVAIIAAAWGYGAIGESDVLLDRGATISTHKLPIIRKQVSRGRSTTYSLITPSWNGDKVEASIDVSEQLWSSLNQGESVCVADHAGALRLRWYAVGRCMSLSIVPNGEP